MGGGRFLVGATAAVTAALVVAACGSSHHAAATTTRAAHAPEYAPLVGRRADAATQSAIGAVLRPDGLPAWAKAPALTAQARIPTADAFTVPLRGGRGWCLGLIVRGRPSVAWCTSQQGAPHAIEGGLVETDQLQMALLARAARPAVRLRVAFAGGRAVDVPLHRGVALAPVASIATMTRPLTVTALDAAGHALAARSLGWSPARWKASRPKTPTQVSEQLAALQKASLKRMRAHPFQASASCTGTKPTPGSSTFTEIWNDQDAPVSAAILTLGGAYAGDLFVKSTAARTRATLIDADGAHRPIDLGKGNCAYIELSAREKARPFRVAWRTAAGTAGTARPGSWTGFPTDG